MVFYSSCQPKPYSPGPARLQLHSERMVVAILCCCPAESGDLQVCCLSLHASLHFLQLEGPEGGLDGQPDALLPGLQDQDAPQQQQQQQQGASFLQVDRGFEQCIQACAPNVSFDHLTTGGGWACSGQQPAHYLNRGTNLCKQTALGDHASKRITELCVLPPSLETAF